MSNTIQLTRKHPDATIPTKGSKLAAGHDVTSVEEVTIEAGKVAIVPTGLSLSFNPTCYLRVAPRSGITIKKNLHVMAGVIDADYTGDIGVVMLNASDKDITIPKGTKIAQLIFELVLTNIYFNVTDKLPETERGEDGYGSTGE